MRTKKAIWLLSTLVTTSSSIGAAQVFSGPLADDLHAVTITFFAEDESGNPVNNLQVSDVSVRDNKKPPLRVVSLHSAQNLPLRLGILIDNNPGGEGYYSQEQHLPVPKLVLDFVEEMLTGPDDKAFIASFSTIRHGATFVSRDQLQQIDLNQFQKTDAPDFLGLRDAIGVACREVFGADPEGRERRILILLGGAENRLSNQVGRSLLDYSQTVSAAQRAGVKVFSMLDWIFSELGTPVEPGRGWPETGGWAPTQQPATGRPDPSRWMERLKSQIDSMYCLTYIPAEPYQARQLRKLKLKITTNKSWHVYAPQRYLLVPKP